MQILFPVSRDCLSSTNIHTMRKSTGRASGTHQNMPDSAPGGPLSDRRSMSHENGEVTFFARIGKKTGGDDETVPIALSGVEFVRRWSLHILPKGYTKTRRFGGYSNHHRQRYIAECSNLLAATGLSAIRDVAATLPPGKSR